MSDLPKLARETSDKCLGWVSSSDEPFLESERQKCAEVILSALEQAYESGRKDACKQSNHTQRLIGLTKLSKTAHEREQSRGEPWTVFNNGAENHGEICGSIKLHDGTGIGLLPLKVCKAVVDAHNASIGAPARRCGKPWTEQTVEAIWDKVFPYSGVKPMPNFFQSVANMHNASIGIRT